MNSFKTPAVWEERRQADWSPRAGDPRRAYEHDRARVIHSAGFRRLQAKTQILGVLEGDFHRTRLTHSMEVAQIGRGLVLLLEKRYPEHAGLLPELETIETIGLSHDLGHPPFGHGGEAALNRMMHGHGGFESNAQSLRLLGRLESHTPNYGLNLTRRSMLGVLKYPSSYSALSRKHYKGEVLIPEQSARREWVPPKCYMDQELPILEWLLNPLSESDRRLFTEHTAPTEEAHGKSLHRSLDASILNLADDIAYGVHDLEDAVALRLIGPGQWEEIKTHIHPEWAEEMEISDVEELLFSQSKSPGHARKEAVGALVHALIQSVELKQNSAFEEPLLAWHADLPEQPKCFLTALKDTVSRHVIHLNTVQSATYRGHRMLLSIFEVLLDEADRLLPLSFRSQWECSSDETSRRRVICDYMAGMTDQYANRIYSRLFMPGQGSVFDRL